MLTHVLLPEGFAVKLNLRQAFIATPGDSRQVLDKVSPDTTGMIKPIAHSYDGSYTHLLIEDWKGHMINVQSAVKDDQLFILVTPSGQGPQYQIDILGGVLWNKPGYSVLEGEIIRTQNDQSQITLRTTADLIDPLHPYSVPYFSVKGGKTFAVYSGEKRSLAEIEKIIDQAQVVHNNKASKFGSLSQGVFRHSKCAWLEHDIRSSQRQDNIARVESMERGLARECPFQLGYLFCLLSLCTRE